MPYPGNKIHRRNRRRLQTGQGPFPAPVTISVAPSGSTMIITFSRPVTVAGNVAATVATRTFVSQVVNSPTQLTITFSGTVAALAWTVPSNSPNLLSYQGGAVLGSSGTFP